MACKTASSFLTLAEHERQENEAGSDRRDARDDELKREQTGRSENQPAVALDVFVRARPVLHA